MSLDVGNNSFYVFVRAPTGPDPRTAPEGPRGGPRAPAGPDPRRAPGGPRAPQGPTRVQGRAQGPGEGPREGPPGPDAWRDHNWNWNWLKPICEDPLLYEANTW